MLAYFAAELRTKKLLRNARKYNFTRPKLFLFILINTIVAFVLAIKLSSSKNLGVFSLCC